MHTHTRALRGAVLVGTLIAAAAAGCGGDDATTSSAATASQAAPVEGRLLFSRFDESSHTFLSTHTAAADGSDETELELPGPEGGGRWSHDGAHIAVMTILDDDRVGTAVITPDGTVERVLGIPDPTLNLVCTVWSPDDARLACEAWDETDATRGGIYTVSSADGSDLQRLTTTPEGLADLPGDFSPDGTQFVILRTPGEEAGQLMLTSTDGGADPQPLADAGFDDPGRFSSDGDAVLTSDGERIVIVGLDGSEIDEISEPGADLFGPVWSPDGEWIAYSRGTSGPHADIYISRPDGSDPRQVTDTPDNEIRVEWGPTTSR